MTLNPDRNYEALFFILYLFFLYVPILALLIWKFPAIAPKAILENWGGRKLYLLTTILLPYGALRGAAALVQMAF